MTNWLLGTKLLLIAYMIMCFVLRGTAQIALVVLCLLLYIIFSMLFLFPKKVWQKRASLSAGILTLIIAAIWVNDLFIFLLPLTILELFDQFYQHARFTLIPDGLVVFFLPADLVPEYLLISVMSILIFTLALGSYSRINTLSTDNDSLREKNDRLYHRLQSSTEYENQVKYMTQLEERNALAQNIHDKLGHVLAGSLIQLEAAAVLMDKDIPTSQHMVRNIVQVLKDGMSDIRSTLRAIKPAPEQLGINRLKTVVDEFAHNSPIQVHLNYSGNLDRITHWQWKIILDNVTESLTNALKYSSANDVKITVDVMNKLIKLEIKDNGIGSVSIKKGLGIKGMEERSENNGGKLLVDGSNGFSVITLLPVKGD
ncbi:histidine kinase [Dehalobacter sp. DCM]|uniref:sensor histidine kinase n=1 Tax=Dehalobacter sp. DCM TaxID=2907827 RepID=UPI00308191BB|nr:histidine kinase [Dehalobacter sp. DCM]